MTRLMLTGIRVASKEEWTGLIYRYFHEIIAIPVPCKRNYKMDDINTGEGDTEDIFFNAVNIFQYYHLYS